jgi:hypothetical protein
MHLRNIAIFGDSFCSLNANSAFSWPSQLAQLTNAKITNFGLPATSILWSYKKLIDTIDQYDWGIWCVSSTQRITINVPIEPWSVHYNGPGCWKNYKSPAVVDLLKVVDDFFLKVDFYEDLNLLYNKLITSALNQYPNLTVIPCFDQPLNVENWLSKISQLEVESLTGLPYNRDWHQKYQDRRPCHLTPQNNEILAKSIIDQFGRQIINLDTNNFNFTHSEHFDNYFTKY